MDERDSSTNHRVSSRQIEKNLLLSFNKFNPDNMSPLLLSSSYLLENLKLGVAVLEILPRKLLPKSLRGLTKVGRVISKLWKRLDKELL